MTLARAMGVLYALRDAGAEGLLAGEVAAATRGHRVTVHRLLSGLKQEGLVEQDGTRRYHLGARLWLLGMAASARFDLAAVARDALERLEHETHDTIYLLRRVGDDVFCVARRDGRYPIKSLVMEVGRSYPLGVGGGGLAVLAALHEGERIAILGRVKSRIGGYPKIAFARIRALLADTVKHGFAFWPALISEAYVVAVPILGADGRPVGALSCAAIKERLDPQRRRKVAALLKAEAEALRQRLSGARMPT